MFNNNSKFIYIVIFLFLLSNGLNAKELNNKTNNEDNFSETVLLNTLINNPKSKTAKLLCAKLYLDNMRYNDAYILIQDVLNEDPENIKAKKLLQRFENVNYSPNNKEKSTKIEINEQENTNTTTDLPIKSNEKINLNDNLATKTNNKNNLPTKEEILLKAKERQSNNSQIFEVKPVPVQDLIIASDEKINSNKPNNLTIKKQENEKTITKQVNTNENEIKEKKEDALKLNTLDPIILVNNNKQNNEIPDSTETKPSTNNIDERKEESEKMYFKPYISNQFSKSKKYRENDYSLNTRNNVNINKNNNTVIDNNLNEKGLIKNTSKSNFLEDTLDSFYVNLEEAYSKIENNDLKTANKLLNNAYLIAVNQKSNKKLLDVQLSRAVILIYQCDFENYGKHILSIRKGINEEIYNSLEKIYESAIKITDSNLLYKYVSNLAYDSGHYLTALELAERIIPPDKDSTEIINKAKQSLKQMSGEILLNNGSYLQALDYFEKENDEAEKGRTYLAISKSLFESKEPENAKIAEKYGFSCLANYIENDPNNPKANLYLALYLLDKGDKNQAKEAIRRGLNAQGTNDLVTSKLLNLAENL